MIRSYATASPRFGKLPPAKKDLLYKTSNWFLGLSQNAADKIDNRFPNPTFKKTPFQLMAKKSLSWIKSNVLTSDYHEMGNLSWAGHTIWGRVLAEPPMGAMTMLLFGPTLLGRLFHAYKRAKENDKREMHDILYRDLPTFVVILYCLNPIVEGFSWLLQKSQGIRLRAIGSGTPYPFSGLRRIYTIKHAEMLRKIVTDEANHAGLSKAISEAIDHSQATDAIRNELKAFQKRLPALLNANPSETALKNATAHLLRIDRDLILPLNAAGKKIPLASQAFLEYATKGRVYAVAPSHAIMAGVLGFGVVAFNAWYAHRDYMRRYGRQNLPPTQRLQITDRAWHPQTYPSQRANNPFMTTHA